MSGGKQIDMVGPLTPAEHIFRRKVTLDAGGVHASERHYLDHESLVTRGTVQFQWTNPDGTTGESLHTADTKTDGIFVPAGQWHTFIAVDGPATWHCLFVGAETRGMGHVD